MGLFFSTFAVTSNLLWQETIAFIPPAANPLWFTRPKRQFTSAYDVIFFYMALILFISKSAAEKISKPNETKTSNQNPVGRQYTPNIGFSLKCLYTFIFQGWVFAWAFNWARVTWYTITTFTWSPSSRAAIKGLIIGCALFYFGFETSRIITIIVLFFVIVNVCSVCFIFIVSISNTVIIINWSQFGIL